MYLPTLANTFSTFSIAWVLCLFGRIVNKNSIKGKLMDLPFSYKYSKIFIKFIGVLVVIAPERGKYE